MNARHFLLTLCVVLNFTVVASAQRFELSVPGEPGAGSTAVLDARVLTIIDARGGAFRYQRAPQFDTPDRRYIGFSSANARQAIRWPASGRGSMQVGDFSGANWRPSRMQIHRIAGFERAALAERDVRDWRFSNRTYVAAAETAPGQTTVGYVDVEGQLQMFQGRGRSWAYLPIPLIEKLVPGAPLALAFDPQSRVPLVYTVGWSGELLEIQGGRNLRNAAPGLQFLPTTVLQLIVRGQSIDIFAVDSAGAIWRINPAPGARPQAIEPRTDRYDAGVPVFVVPGRPDQLFVVDRRGALVRYTVDAGPPILVPQLVDFGFASGAHIAGAIYDNADGVAEAYVAAVDADGQMGIYFESQDGWARIPSPAPPFTMSTPLTFANSPSTVRLMSVSPAGIWEELESIGGEWDIQPLTEGFNTGAPIAVTTSGNEAFAVDSLGRLVAATRRRGGWDLALVVPGAEEIPRLVRRTTTRSQPLATVNVFFDNTSPEPIIYRIDNLANPAAVIERRLAPRQSATETLSRTSGGVLEEVYAVPLPDGTWVEEVNRIDLPAAPGLRVTVFAERTTYQYIDRRKNKPAGALPDFDRKSLVSIGVFLLPPGELLQDGTRIDVVAEAQAARNPGAAALP